jgi:D-beta-D-heptose 7-phosphate kinase/D-beta-D-heptose 1-phosphate adenosyltransferase
VVKVEHIEERPGGAANVALNSAALGAQAVLLGLTGQDEAADALASQMAGVKVACDFVRLTDYPTITKLRVLSRNQQLLRLDFEEAFHDVDASLLMGKVEQALPQADVMILSDYGKGALNDVPGMIRRARAAGIPVLVDPKGTDFEKYRGATLLTPNMSEFEAVVGKVKGKKTWSPGGWSWSSASSWTPCWSPVPRTA